MNDDLNLGLELLEWYLERATGLEPFECKVSSLFAASTWHLPQLDRFPLLVFLGGAGTGKSSALAVLSSVVYQPHVFSGKMTAPALRENMAKARDATILIDEADNLPEALLINRYSKTTAITAVMLPTPDNGWLQVSRKIFGASILARRLPFRDPALTSRSIIIETKINAEKASNAYQPINPKHADKIRSLFEKCSKEIPLTGTTLPPNIQGRIAETFFPLLSLAETIGDKSFLEEAHDRLRLASETLKIGQEFEPSPILLRSLVAIQTRDNVLSLRPVPLMELRDAIFQEYNLRLNSVQISQMLKSLGFITEIRGGRSRVLPNHLVLRNQLKAFGISDQIIEGP